jgi:hypothetical protein
MTAECHSPLQRNIQPRRRSLFLNGLLGILVIASFLAVTFIPRDEHSPRILMHPLSSIKHSQPQDEASIRYLTFGSSSTWGEGLEHPHEQAYPWQLSPQVHNVAARVGGISLSAICTQSIVGEGVYDVIVLEFSDTDVDGVIQLAARIRQRFPLAQMIFVRLWSPVTHVVYDGTTPLLDWWSKLNQQQQQPENKEDSLLQSYPFQSALLNSDSNKWSFANYYLEAARIDQVIEQVQGYLYQLPFPDASLLPIPIILTSSPGMALFQDANPRLLSPQGHAKVAEGILRLVRQAPPLTSLNGRNQVGSWGSGDDCSLWYGTGDYSTLRSRRRASLVDFSKGTDGFHKHAVEISRRGGSLDVDNSFPETRMLYLTYMTAASPQEKKNAVREYPRTKVTVGGKASLLIDPVHDDADNDRHLTRTTAVGLVPPGRTVIKLDSLDPDSTSRFRLVGLHFLTKGKVPIPFEFDLEPDTAHR